MMKRRKIFSVALILGALLWPSLAPTAQGQPGGKRFVANTGVIRLSAGQILRLTINGQSGSDALTVSFRRMYYVGTTNGGVWKSSLMAQDTSGPITITPNEAARHGLALNRDGHRRSAFELLAYPEIEWSSLRITATWICSGCLPRWRRRAAYEATPGSKRQATRAGR